MKQERSGCDAKKNLGYKMQKAFEKNDAFNYSTLVSELYLEETMEEVRRYFLAQTNRGQSLNGKKGV